MKITNDTLAQVESELGISFEWNHRGGWSAVLTSFSMLSIEVNEILVHEPNWVSVTHVYHRVEGDTSDYVTVSMLQNIIRVHLDGMILATQQLQNMLRKQ